MIAVCKCIFLSLLILPISLLSFARVEISDSEKIGTELTPMGAQIEGNKEGTIPKWTGSIRGLPKGLEYKGSGSEYPNVYASEKPLFVITKDNIEQYKYQLTPGFIALMEAYPDTFTIPVYKSHRDFRYSEDIELRTRWNVGRAKLESSIDDLLNFTGGAPFPLPENGAQVIWNARMNYPLRIANSTFDEVTTLANGNQQLMRMEELLESPMTYEEQPVGRLVEELGENAALIILKMIEPKRRKGEILLVHEPVNQQKYPRKSWIYIPGAQRVKRAPTVGHDTPFGPGGYMTADDRLGFNGAMYWYDWKLIGKKEMYVPYHNYRFDTAAVKYDQLLTPLHANADYMRYELRRVWVVEATLKDGEKHIYPKRRFYVEEDNWLIVATEAYDGQDELWRVGMNTTLYDYYLEGYILRVQMMHDLQSKAYMAIRLVNETHPTDYSISPKGEAYYTPENLQRMGRH